MYALQVSSAHTNGRYCTLEEYKTLPAARRQITSIYKSLDDYVVKHHDANSVTVIVDDDVSNPQGPMRSYDLSYRLVEILDRATGAERVLRSS